MSVCVKRICDKLFLYSKLFWIFDWTWRLINIKDMRQSLLKESILWEQYGIFNLVKEIFNF